MNIDSVFISKILSVNICIRGVTIKDCYMRNGFFADFQFRGNFADERKKIFLSLSHF